MIERDVYHTVKSQGICTTRPTKRGKYAFTKRQLPIPSFVTQRTEAATLPCASRGANLSNLKPIPKFVSSDRDFKFCLWNGQSIRNKSIYICDCIIERDIDTMVICG